MKKIQNHFRLVIMVMMGIVFLGCEKKDIAGFSAAPAVNFTSKSMVYSFLTNPQSEYIQNIEVQIMGNVADVDRTFSAEVINDSTTTATPDQYEVIGGVIPAGSLMGKLAVKIKNSTALNTKEVFLKLKLIDGLDLKAGTKENITYVLGWTNKIVVPTTWTYYNIFFATKSTQVYRLILQTTGIASLTAAQYSAMGGEAAAIAAGTKFGDYVKQWNLDHPNDQLKHDDGTAAGQVIVPKYYTKSKYN
ncbi:DUF4843 domain-containing protein [Pedobacter insulae]|uniref:DUF4843 domain-containing protein n=1 Tax=Pedobacter insulae TaxID=414048 RepID=A0A1I2XFU2_9SPHI|nr:DUF4843 domain-containing protein [Pedobacter insulae]SFH12353.1 protein of unknown function [Pedobacter insulae]